MSFKSTARIKCSWSLVVINKQHHITTAMQHLYWLPTGFQIVFDKHFQISFTVEAL